MTIPAGTPNAPTLSTTFSQVANLTVAPGATLTLTTFSLTASGNVDVGGTIAGNSTLVMSGTGVTLRGSVQNLTINGTVTLNGNTTTAAIGTVSISGVTADLNLGGFTFVANNFLTQSGATLTMTNPADSLVSTGTAQFAGGSTLGRLTAGVIELRASLIQSPGGSTTSFASTGTRVRATGTGAVTYTINSGGAALSRFSSLIVAKGGGNLNLSGASVVATDSVAVTSATILSVSGTLIPLRTLRLGTGAGVTGAGTLRITADSLFVTTPTNYTVTTTEFNGTGPQVIPVLGYNNLTLSGSSTHTLAGNTAATGTVSVSGAGARLVLGNRSLAAGSFATATGGVVTMTQPLDSLLVTGNASFNGGDETVLMSAGVVRAGANFTVAAANSFVATGTHKTIFGGSALQALSFANGGPAANRFQDLQIDVAGGFAVQLIGSTTTVTGNLQITRGQLSLNGRRMDVGGNLSVTGSTSTVSMINAGDSLFVTGNATFAGASTATTLTNGVVKVAGDFTQNATVSTLSYSPGGTHKTVLGGPTLRNVSIGSPGAGAAGSHFQVLDVTPATGGISLDVNMQADSLISTATAARISSPGVTLTARRAQVTGLTFDQTYFALDEQGVASTETFSNVTFGGYTGGSNVLLTVIGPGSSSGRPVVTTANLNFQTLGIGAANFYVDLTSSNGLAFGMTMTGSNQGSSAGGNGPALTRVTPGTGVATVSWP